MQKVVEELVRRAHFDGSVSRHSSGVELLVERFARVPPELAVPCSGELELEADAGELR